MQTLMEQAQQHQAEACTQVTSPQSSLPPPQQQQQVQHMQQAQCMQQAQQQHQHQQQYQLHSYQFLQAGQALASSQATALGAAWLGPRAAQPPATPALGGAPTAFAPATPLASLGGQQQQQLGGQGPVSQHLPAMPAPQSSLEGVLTLNPSSLPEADPSLALPPLLGLSHPF